MYVQSFVTFPFVFVGKEKQEGGGIKLGVTGDW
jgi:hypothetical protein